MSLRYGWGCLVLRGVSEKSVGRWYRCLLFLRGRCHSGRVETIAPTAPILAIDCDDVAAREEMKGTANFKIWTFSKDCAWLDEARGVVGVSMAAERV